MIPSSASLMPSIPDAGLDFPISCARKASAITMPKNIS
jgi:hypothetical protein